MSAEGISIQVDDRDIMAALGRLASFGGNLTPVLEEIGGALKFSAQYRISDSKIGPDGRPWQKLAPRTARERARKGYGPQDILRRQHRLGDSIVYLVENDTVEVGTNNPYAAIQQLGGTVKHGAREAAFRYADEGAATTKEGKRVGSRLRFAKADSRAKTLHARTVPAYTATIPARPYLGISEPDKAEILFILNRAIEKAIGERP